MKGSHDRACLNDGSAKNEDEKNKAMLVILLAMKMASQWKKQNVL